MKLDSYKELYPVVYGETAIKPLRFGPLKKSTYCFGPHWHNRIEFIRVIKGSINILIKDETKVINEGELAIICPCQLHEGRVLEDKTEYYVIMFDIEEFYNSTVASKKFLEPLVQTNITFNSFSKEKEIIDVIAQHLLKKTNSEIALIASLCGFSDISYFAQIFHTHYGMSPTDFRKKQHSKG